MNCRRGPLSGGGRHGGHCPCVLLAASHSLHHHHRPCCRVVVQRIFMSSPAAAVAIINRGAVMLWLFLLDVGKEKRQDSVLGGMRNAYNSIP